jgi:bifunctional N-acetylglucosamine-1-phosphate-uridyltransferase/glucosamine-1-phosphate-acetyltransferase GlmU-like protein
MSDNNPQITRELKIVILAAGKDSGTSAASSILLKDLGDRKVVDYVVEQAVRLVGPEDIYIVTGRGQEEMRLHLGNAYQFIQQEEQLGTGHAVLQLEPRLKNLHGHLLILYGDTPSFSAPIRSAACSIAIACAVVSSPC